MRDARNGLDRLYRAVGDVDASQGKADANFINCLLDDLNTPAAVARLHELARSANKGDDAAAKALKASAAVLGLLQQSADGWAKADDASTGDGLDDAAIDGLIDARKQARANREFAKADKIRDQLNNAGIILEDSADGTIWRRR
jgi:cysteinyl-tRNA synthetase